MADTTFPWHRLALIPVLAENAPGGQIGRTALMKFAYFLQTLRSVPLGYRFTLIPFSRVDPAHELHTKRLAKRLLATISGTARWWRRHIRVRGVHGGWQERRRGHDR